MKRAIILALVVIVLLWAGIGTFAYVSWKGWFHTRTVRGSGEVVKQTRPISGVTAVECIGSWEVDVTQGDTESLVVEAARAIHDLPIETALPQLARLIERSRMGLGFATIRDDFKAQPRKERLRRIREALGK